MMAIGEYSDDDTASSLKARDYKDATDLVAHPSRGEGFDTSEDGAGEDGAGHGTPLVPVAGAICKNSFTGGAGGRPEGAAAGHFIPVAFDCKGTEVQYDVSGIMPPLRSMSRSNSHQNAGGHAAIAFDLRGRDGGAMPEGPHDTANIRAASGGSSRPYVATPWAVRRLTPTECHRLQGFPDDHCAIAYRGKPAADGPQYKALGNSMAVPCVKWIMDRMRVSIGHNGGRAT